MEWKAGGPGIITRCGKSLFDLYVKKVIFLRRPGQKLGEIVRLKLHLHVDTSHRLLPINYHYALSSWIYKVLNRGDTEFAQWLHERGYHLESKHFKLFTFSRIIPFKYKRISDRLKIISRQAELQLSFFVEKAVENFIIGLFQGQEFEIADYRNKCGFFVETVESLPLPEFKATMNYRWLSPICVSRSVERSGKRSAEYLHPSHPEYERRFIDNLVYKYLAATNKMGEAKENLKNPAEFKFAYKEPAKSHLETIKAGMPEETRVRGYFYNFTFTAPPELQRLGYLAGFGEKNSLGFGFVECIG